MIFLPDMQSQDLPEKMDSPPKVNLDSEGREYEATVCS